MASSTGPKIPSNPKYVWDFSNHKGQSNEILTKQALTLSDGASISSNQLSVDGNDDKCATGLDISWNDTNSVSWFFWFNPTAAVASGGILGKQDSQWEWSFYQSGNDLKLVYWNSSGGHTNGMDFGVDGIINDEWNLGAYTWNHTTEGAKFYLYNSSNNSSPATNTHTATDSSINQNRTNQFMMGGNIYTWSDKYWGGEISSVYFYERTLDDNDVNIFFQSTRGKFGI
jgi:hypothetical protein